MRRLLVALSLAGAAVCGVNNDPPAIAPGPKDAADPPAAAGASPAASELPTAAGLHYREIVTAGALADDALPMIVAIHGLGDDPDGFSDLVSDFGRPARIVLPRAPDVYEGGGFSWFPVLARDDDPEALARGIEGATRRIADALREISGQRPTIGKPIVTGFSQGGMLAFALAVRHPELISATYPVGGWLPPPLWPARADDPALFPPIVALHGDSDPAIPLGPTQDAIARLQGLGLSARIRVYPGVKHAITPEMRRDLHQLLEQAHSRAVPPPEDP